MADTKCLRCKVRECAITVRFCQDCQREMYRNVQPVVYGERKEEKPNG